MTPVIPAACGALIVLGLLGLVAGIVRTPRAKRATVRPTASIMRWSTRQTVTAATSALVGLLIAVWSGWLLAAILFPAAVVGLPLLLSSSDGARQIRRLEAMEEWTRSLAGMLTAGVGLEQAVIATYRSCPEALRPEVGRLVSRLRSQWTTDAAIRGFADDVNDATGDLIAANLLLASRRRGPGLATVLEALAASVADDVRARRQVEADRAKPRTTARTVTIITVVVLGVLAATGSYVAPFGSPVGQVLLGLELAAYAGVLVWMQRMSMSRPLPRFIGASARAEVER